jgi:hypothetical protein
MQPHFPLTLRSNLMNEVIVGRALAELLAPRLPRSATYAIVDLFAAVPATALLPELAQYLWEHHLEALSVSSSATLRAALDRIARADIAPANTLNSKGQP